MNSPAIKQNPASLAEQFAAHLEVVKKRAAAALASTGYDALLLHSGTPPLIFLDDHHLPYRVQAPFKVWAPLTDAPDSFVWFAPGKKPLLLIFQPVDYWHQSPTLPDAYWTPAFDIVSVDGREAARAALPGDLSRTAFIGAPFPELVGWGPGAINPHHLLSQLDYSRAAKTPYELACLREANAIGARGHLAAERAFVAAGVNPRDVDVAEVHDATAPAEILAIETLGLVARGEGAAFTSAGETARDGSIAVNPSGGLLARGHPIGATGVAQVAEIVWQLRGDAGERQVAGASIGVTQNSGGVLGGEVAVAAVTVIRR